MGDHTEGKGRWTEKCCERKTCGKRIPGTRVKNIRFTNNVKRILEIFFAVAVNQDFDLRIKDIRVAFLQARELDQDVFLMPPKDIRKEGYVWKLKKPLYGLNDASRKFWLRVKELFAVLGLSRRR